VSSQSEYLSFCQNELRRSKRWRESKQTTNYDGEWRRFVDLYQGKHYDAKNNVDQLTVNLIFATINVMAPAIAISNPKFNVNPRNPQSGPQALIAEEVLNYIWRTHHFQRDFRLAVLDMLICGHGWLKAGYKATKPKEVKNTDLDLNAEIESVTEGVDDREDIPGNSETEMSFHSDEDRPYLERISIFDMFVDPDARHPKEMRWIAQRTWRPVSDVKVDSRYSATQRSRASGSTYSRWNYGESDARRSGEHPDKGAVSFCEVIEFYDIRKGKVSTFIADGQGSSKSKNSPPSARTSGFLIKPSEIPYSFGHPFVMLRNYEVPDHFYPIGDVAQIESLQLELNETRNQMLNYRKKFRRAWVYAKDLFDRQGIQALESDEDNVAIPVMGDGNPASAISPVPPAITPPEFFDQSAMISSDLDRVSGVSDYQRGGNAGMKRTATEAAMIQDASNARAQDRLAKIENILSECGEKIVQLMQQFTTEEKVARIVTMPVRGWFPYKPRDVQGQFDFDVVGGSTEPQNESFRRQSALQIADVSAMFASSGVVNMPNLYMKLLRDGFGIKDAERYVQQQPPPPGGPGGPPPGMPPGGPGGPPPGMPPGGPGGAPTELTPETFAMLAAEQGPPPPAGPGGMPDELTPEMLAMLATQQGSPPPPMA